MKIIAPTNNKGGVGKTKVSEILAEYFSKVQGKRTLAIDLDSQCNFSQHYIDMDIDPTYPQGKIPPIHPEYDPDDPDDADWNGRSSIADIYLGEPVIPYPTKINNLDIALGNSETLEEVQQVRKEELAEKVHDQLHMFLSDPAVAEEYDVIIIDTAPSKGPLTVSAIKAADHIIIPSIMEEQPIQGVYGMVQLWMQERVRRPVDRPLDLLGILPNLFRTTNLHKDMLESLQQDDHLGRYVIPHYLSQRTSFAEADVKGVSPESIFDLPNSNPAKQQAMRLCEFINERVFG